MCVHAARKGATSAENRNEGDDDEEEESEAQHRRVGLTSTLSRLADPACMVPDA